MGGAAAAYRQLLRAIRRSIKTANELQQWEKYAREQFLMAAAHGPDASLSSTAAVQDAVDYAFLVDSVRQHKVRFMHVQHILNRVPTIDGDSRAACNSSDVSLSSAGAPSFLQHWDSSGREREEHERKSSKIRWTRNAEAS